MLAVLAFAAIACEKPVDPDMPAINWASNPSFSQVELAPGLDGSVSVSAPGKIDMFTITLGLGEYALLANPHIGLSSNKGSASKSPVFDLVDDTTTAAFLKKLGITAGSGLRGKTLASLDLVAVFNALIEGQVVSNNSIFTMKIDVRDQAGKTATATAKFHFTSAPALYWDANPNFEVVNLNDPQKALKIRVNAPGKIDKLTIKLENGADPKLMTYIQNRTTGSTTIIDLIGDEKVGDSFKGYFPAGATVSGKVDVTLDFGFMYSQKYDMSASTNVFTITAVDKNGKTTTAQAKFKL